MYTCQRCGCMVDGKSQGVHDAWHVLVEQMRAALEGTEEP